MQEYYTGELLKVEAHRDNGGDWLEFSQTQIANKLILAESHLTPRKVTMLVRELGYITDSSKGLIKVIELERNENYVAFKLTDKGSKRPMYTLRCTRTGRGL